MLLSPVQEGGRLAPPSLYRHMQHVHMETKKTTGCHLCVLTK